MTPAKSEQPAAQQHLPGSTPFRFYDNRQKYLAFVNTCNEKAVIAARASRELMRIQPTPPALKIIDAGIGDGTVLSRLLRTGHRHFPTVPVLVVGKEMSLEDVRLALEKMPDRFHEHPHTVLAVTNVNYRDVPHLAPREPHSAGALNWHDVALEGTTASEFGIRSRRSARSSRTAGRPARTPRPATRLLSGPRCWSSTGPTTSSCSTRSSPGRGRTRTRTTSSSRRSRGGRARRRSSRPRRSSLPSLVASRRADGSWRSRAGARPEPRDRPEPVARREPVPVRPVCAARGHDGRSSARTRRTST